MKKEQNNLLVYIFFMVAAIVERIESERLTAWRTRGTRTVCARLVSRQQSDSHVSANLSLRRTGTQQSGAAVEFLAFVFICLPVRVGRGRGRGRGSAALKGAKHPGV